MPVSLDVKVVVWHFANRVQHRKIRLDSDEPGGTQLFVYGYSCSIDVHGME
jgi:hypothetical protein